MEKRAAVAAPPLSLRLRLYRGRAVGWLVDCGTPYDEAGREAVVPLDDLLAIPEGGYGLQIARAALDSLRYRRTAGGLNCWRLVKRLP